MLHTQWRRNVFGDFLWRLQFKAPLCSWPAARRFDTMRLAVWHIERSSFATGVVSNRGATSMTMVNDARKPRRRHSRGRRMLTMSVVVVGVCGFRESSGFGSSALVKHETTRAVLRRPATWFSMTADDDDDDDDDDEAPSVDTSTFIPLKSSIAFGLNRGRSAPSQRKAMGTSGSGSTSVHVCTNCGSEFVKWMGRCPTCREWNTLQEFKVDRGETSTRQTNRPTFFSPPRRSVSWLDGTHGEESYHTNEPIRVTDVYKEMDKTIDNDSNAPFTSRERRIIVPGDKELNNVLGGGIMSGSLTLLGGDPGVGKSTLLLQTAASVASLSQPSLGIGMGIVNGKDSNKTLGPVWYVSGEENAEQIASRAARLGIVEKELFLLSETHVDTLAEQVVASYQQPVKTTEGEAILGQAPKPPALLVIDSIQTMVCEAGGVSAAGGVTQVSCFLNGCGKL